MRGDAIFVLSVLLTSLALFMSERLALEVVALLVVVALILGGVLTPAEALAGFSDPLVVTIGALFVVGTAVQQTGLGAALGERVARVAGNDEGRLIAATMLACACLSAFMSTTGAVAMLMPVIVGVGRRAGVPPARLLMPLAFGGHLGSTLTLVATPPNLIASNQLSIHGQPGLGFFTITPYGVLLFACGIAYMVLVGRHMLPGSAQAAATLATGAPARPEQEDASRALPGQLARLRVPPGAPIAGRTLAEAAPRSRTGVTIVAASRDGRSFMAAGPETVLRAEDVLVVHGDPAAVGRLVALAGLESAPAPTEEVDPAAQGEDLGTVEALLPPRSTLLGRTLAEVHLRERTGATALAILRQGTPIQQDLARARLAMGDVLLLHGPWSRLALLRDDAHDLLVLGPLAPRRPARRALTTALTAATMVALMATGLVPVVVAALLAAVALVLARCVTLEDAYRGISWSALILIAGMLPMATALERTGVVRALVEALTGALGPLGPTAALAGILLLANLLGLVLSNTATAVLLAPIAYDVALGLGASPRTMLLGLALACSMAFSTPVSSPVNTLVVAPGGYRFRDFVRVGVPLQALAFALTVAMLALGPAP